MLTEKYRPHRLDDVVGQEQVVELIRSQSLRDAWFPVQLLYGQFGGGKTTIARIIALCANCQHKDSNGNPCLECDTCKGIMEGTHPDVIEIAAAVHNGVDDVRELVQYAEFKPVELRYKIYIIDEVHSLSKGAFNALLKLLEEPPEHCIFILCTTEKDMILDTIQSRTAPYSFTSLSREQIKGHLLHIADMEGFEVSEDAASVIAKRAFGSVRTALMLLEMATKESGKATGESVEKMLGISKPFEIFEVIRTMIMQDKAGLVRKMVRLNESGANIHELLTDLSEGMTDLALASVFPEGLFGSDSYVSLIREIIPYGNTELFQVLADELITLKGSMSREMRGQDLTVKLLGILLGDKVSGCSRLLLSKVELLQEEMVQIKSAMSICASDSARVMEEDRTGQEDLDFSDTGEQRLCKKNSNRLEQPVQKVNLELSVREEVREVQKDTTLAETEIMMAENIVSVSNDSAQKNDSDKESVGSDGFIMPEDDLFDFMIGNFEPAGFSMENPMGSTESNPEQKQVPVTLGEEKAYRILNQMCEEDVAFRAAVANCEITKEDEKVIIRTPFRQTVKFVEAYLKAYANRYSETDIEGICVMVTEELTGLAAQ